MLEYVLHNGIVGAQTADVGTVYYSTENDAPHSTSGAGVTNISGAMSSTCDMIYSTTSTGAAWAAGAGISTQHVLMRRALLTPTSRVMVLLQRCFPGVDTPGEETGHLELLHST